MNAFGLMVSMILWTLIISVYSITSLCCLEYKRPVPLWAYPGIFMGIVVGVSCVVSLLLALAYPFYVFFGGG